MVSKKENKEKIQEQVAEDAEVEDEDSEDHALFNEKMQSRFYRKDFPEEGDLVIVGISTFSRSRCLIMND
jgi:hypothetical protein